MTSCSSPVFKPTIPSSNPGIIELDPRTSLLPSACPPSKASPSTVPEKSIVTWSSSAAARSTAKKDLRCSLSFSIIISRSSGDTSATGFDTLISSNAPNLISGKISIKAENERSLSNSITTSLISGMPAGFKDC